MDHTRFLASVPPEDRLRLTRRSDARGLAHLAGHLALIALPAAGIVAGVPGWPILMLPLGIALVFLFTLQHETTHLTPFRTRALSLWVGRLCGLILALPHGWFTLFHMAHHRHTQDPARDPELATPKPTTRAGYAWHLTGLPTWRAQLSTLWRNAFGAIDAPYIPARRHADLRREARLMLAIYTGLALASLAAGTAALLWLWIMPLLLGQPVLRLYLLAEHGRCPTVADMFLNTRTTLTSRAVRFLAWNMPFHAEHHAWPAVPFHQLPALHARARSHLARVSPGYAAFHRAYRAGLTDGAPDAH
ncbi:fatty acid desaturase [Jannaschia marina]|uniref:fatty acid desaturase n=1 Tax=Jannaschia marina TaxID=2741674 RepID=UPI0015C8B52E|nr:fatty acid desaturase [Jannaschia marina]